LTHAGEQNRNRLRVFVAQQQGEAGGIGGGERHVGLALGLFVAFDLAHDAGQRVEVLDGALFAKGGGEGPAGEVDAAQQGVFLVVQGALEAGQHVVGELRRNRAQTNHLARDVQNLFGLELLKDCGGSGFAEKDHQRGDALQRRLLRGGLLGLGVLAGLGRGDSLGLVLFLILGGDSGFGHT